MLPLSVAEKLLLLAGGESLPASALKNPITDELINDNIVAERITGRTRRSLYLPHREALAAWLYNRFQINDLANYIEALKEENTTRARAVDVANNSKLLGGRTYKGFLLNSFAPVQGTLHGQPFIVHPPEGTFQFVYDYEAYRPDSSVVIVGVENMESFRFVGRQATYFAAHSTLFVSRYPQEQAHDLMKWLRSIPNNYIHFGDFDFAGIGIYLNEYKKHLGERASFFIPDHLEVLLERHGNRALYDQQKAPATPAGEPALDQLVALLHKYKMGLEQEALLIAAPEQ